MLSYRDLVVWQKSKDFVIRLYKITNSFPTEEKFGLTSQMRRSAISIPSNIAEGRGRRSRKDFVQFLYMSVGSLCELETQIEIAKDLRFIKEVEYNDCIASLKEIGRMLASMIEKLKAGT
ncbi:MAG: four helix bundle protein [Candidatus Pacebacteria bacterium]|nr:four helix bundle protein [Candidatus Paceibacterota bacterium]MBP9832345.1 four helix bundle protein [Candidatus Paceibacterota bacterium]